MNGKFERHTIIQGFQNVKDTPIEKDSPGFCYPFYPKVGSEGKENAHIFIAGDGDFSAHLLRPKENM